MRKVLLQCVICMLLSLSVLAQNKRPQVLVYGSGVDAYAAAMQAAMSNLNTVWVQDQDVALPELTSRPVTITSSVNLDAGVWADLLARTRRQQARNDSVATLAKQRINPQIVQNMVNDTLMRYKHLTIVRGQQVRSVKSNRRGWTVELNNRQTYRVLSLIDATDEGSLYQLASGGNNAFVPHTAVPIDYFVSASQSSELYRTGVAVGDIGHVPYTIPLATMIPDSNQNLFVTRWLPVVKQLTLGNEEDIPLLMHVGQAVGAAAGYVAFYKTTVDKIDVRSIQGELLQYGARLVPYTDVPISHRNFAAIQRVGATGLFRPWVMDTSSDFQLDEPVRLQELQAVMNQLFSRSQIWFIDHQHIDTLTVEDLFSLIRYVGHRGKELEGQVERAWSRNFGFPEGYDPKQTATRRHVAVLLDAYCAPFDVKVGLDGRIHR